MPSPALAFSACRRPALSVTGLLLTTLLLSSGFALAEAAAPAATGKPVVPEASIAFADHGGVRDWEGDGERGLWVQASNGHWYYGTFAAPCQGLQFHDTLKFKFSPSGSMDRYSQVETRNSGASCWFVSFTASEGPPKKAKPTASSS